METTANTILSDAILDSHISQNAQKTLYEIALDPHGIEQSAAPGLVASILDFSLELSNQIIIELLGKQLLVRKCFDDEFRLFANYELLKIDDSVKSELLSHQEAFENLREAHSISSMKSLDDFFEKSEGTIYLGCEVTSHHTFKKLQMRAETGKCTVFLMPRENDVSLNHRIHYNEIIDEWVRFVKQGPIYLKKNILIRITSKPFPQIFTSGISSDIARFNLYFFSSHTTRRGSLLQVKNGTSLYKLILETYQNALVSSYPLWRVWFFKAFIDRALGLVFPIILIGSGVIITKFNSTFSTVLSAIIVGIVANFIWSKLGFISWKRMKLFKN